MEYPIKIVPDDNGTLLVTFPDVPEAITCGNDEAEARANALDALEVALSGYIQDRRDLPVPTEPQGLPTVALGLLGELKVACYRAMRARGWRKADLARALEVNPRQVDRLLDLQHGSTVTQLEAALTACGQRVDVQTRDVAPAA